MDMEWLMALWSGAGRCLEPRDQAGRPGPALPGRTAQMDCKGGAGKISHSPRLLRAGRIGREGVRRVHIKEHLPKTCSASTASPLDCGIFLFSNPDSLFRRYKGRTLPTKEQEMGESIV